MLSIVSEARQVRRSVAMSRRRMAASWEEQEENREEPPPLWMAPVDSGVLTSLIFFVAMCLCLWSIPLGEQPGFKYRLSLHVTIWYSVLFVVESAIDLGFGAYRWRVEAKMEADQVQLAAVAAYPQAPQVSAQSYGAREQALTELFPDKSYGRIWLDKVHWDVWASLVFLVASLFYLISAVFDVGGWAWMDIFHSMGLNDEQFSSICSQIGAWLFVLDSFLCLAGRYTYRRTIAPRERLIIFRVWKLRGFFQVDWAAWGDMFFFAGAVASIICQYDESSEALSWFSEILWTFDALFYLFGCLPTFVGAISDSMQGGGDTTDACFPDAARGPIVGPRNV